MPDTTFTIPDHELIANIGHGSYGEVWLAKSATGRYRAVKVVFRNRFKTNHPFERELTGIRQFEPISRTHEGLVDILHVGETGAGYFYYIMEAADDRNSGPEIDPAHYSPATLTSRLQSNHRLDPMQCVELGMSLARALAHLHESGLVHRDIKPSNIIFVNGSPKLADIGLVTNVENANSYVGTEGFIPPEGPGSKQADIFSLGKVLYEAATGRDRQQFPELPTQLDETGQENAFMELNAVILKACHPNPTLRYQSAREMLKELATLEGGESVRRLHALESRMKLVKRGVTLAGAVAALATIILIPLVRNRALVREMHQRERGTYIANGTHDLNDGNLLASLPQFVSALRLEAGDRTREHAHRLRIASILAYSPKLTDMEFAGRELSSIEFSPDGNSLAAVEWFSQVRLYGTGGSSNETSLPIERAVDASFSPDGRCVLTADWGGTALIWDRATGKTNAVFRHPRQIESARFSHDGLKIVTASDDKIARVWDRRTGALLLELTGHEGIVFFAAFSPDDATIVTTSADHTARIWNAATGQEIGAPLPHQRWVMQAAFSPDNLRIVTACQDNTAHLWDISSRRMISFPMEHFDRVNKAVFSPDGSIIATAGLDGTVRLWDGYTGQRLKQHSVLKHSSRVEGVSFSPDGRRLASCCLDGSIRVWDFAVDSIPSTSIRGAVSADGRTLAMARGGELLIGSPKETRDLPRRFDFGTPISEAALTANGKFGLVLTKQSTNAIFVVETKGLRRVSPFIPAGNETNLANFTLSPNGKRLVRILPKGVAITDVEHGSPLANPLDEDQRFSAPTFNSDGTQLACASGATLVVWNPDGGGSYRTNFPTVISSIAFSPNDEQLLVALSDSSYSACAAYLVEAKTGKTLSSPFRHHDGVRCAAFDPFGTLFATGGEDFVLMVWNPKESKPVARMQHSDQLKAIAFNNDATVLCSWTSDRKLRLWDPISGEPLSPPIFQPGPPLRLVSLPQSDAFLAVTNGNQMILWEPRVEARPLEDLELLAQLLSNEWPFETELSTRHIRSAWRRLRALYPETFSVSNERVLAWRQEQLRAARENKDETKARFHAEFLAKSEMAVKQ